MTKLEFYQQRDNKVKSDFEELSKDMTVRKAMEKVAEMNQLSYSVVDTIIYPRTYRMKNKISTQKTT